MIIATISDTITVRTRDAPTRIKESFKGGIIVGKIGLKTLRPVLNSKSYMEDRLVSRSTIF
jgi:hypothetical protein